MNILQLKSVFLRKIYIAFAWVNILLQILSPVVITLTPVISAKAAQSNTQRFLSDPIDPTEIYTLGQGETIETVAKKFKTNVIQIKKLNELKQFPQGIENVRIGDKIRVPVISHSSSRLLASLQNKEKKQSQDVIYPVNNPEAPLASTSGNATAYATSIVTNRINQEAQQWLGRFGTARVQINAADSFSLKNSQLDLLLPFKETQDYLIFNQNSLHRTDHRSQANIGLGFRYFHDNYMVGGNTFWDYDLSQTHSRLGIGLEYSQDFIKLGANSYWRLSSWKNTNTLLGYEARPVNGWDVRVDGYLPFYPALGTKLVYEQYYGNEVALFGQQDRQKDPYAITLGASYTPFPLLKFTAEKRMGKSGSHDSRFGVEVNYQIGVPFSQQLSPSTLDSHYLANQRYALVERNNNIILDYKAKTPVHFSTFDKLSGYGGEQKSLGVTVQAVYGLDKIVWTADTLIAQNGQIVPISKQSYDVILPPYRAGGTAANTYIVNAVAYDIKGNASAPAKILIEVLPSNLNTAILTLSANKDMAQANGADTITLTLTVANPYGNAISGTPIHWSTTKNQLDLNETLTDSQGKTQVTLKGTEEGIATVTAMLADANTIQSNYLVTFSAFEPDELQSQFTVQPQTIVGDGIQKSLATLVVKDRYGNAVSGMSPVYDALKTTRAIGSATFHNPQEKGNGVYTVEISADAPGIYRLSASLPTLSGTAFMKQTTLGVIEDNPDIQIMSVNVDRDTAKADGRDSVTVTVKVQDKISHTALENIPVGFTTSLGQLNRPIAYTDVNGIATVSLSSLTAGSATIYALVGTDKQPADRTVTFIMSELSPSASSLVLIPTTIVANGVDTAIATVTLNSVDGLPLTHLSSQIALATDRGLSLMISGFIEQAGYPGQYSATIRGLRQGETEVIASVNGIPLTQTSHLTLIPDLGTARVTDLYTDKKAIQANGTDTALLTAVVKDEKGNLLSNYPVSWSYVPSNDTTLTPLNATTNALGQVSAKLVGNKNQLVAVSAKLGNGNQRTESIDIVSNPETATITLAADKNSVNADGKDAVTLVATVKDANGNLLTNEPVIWRSSLNTPSAETTQTDDKGQVSITLSGTVAGQAKLTALLTNGEQGQADIIFLALSPNIDNSTLTIYPQTIVVNGESATLRFTLNDQFNNPISGRTIQFTANPVVGLSIDPVVDHLDGTYSAQVRGTQAGIFTLTGQVVPLAGETSVEKTVALGVIADTATAAITTVIVDKTTAQANGTDMVTITATVHDNRGNPVNNIAVGFSSLLGQFNTPLAYTNLAGVATVTLSSQQAGQTSVYALLGTTQQKANSDITFVPGLVNLDTSSLTLSPAVITADGRSTATVTLQLKDAQGNGISGKAAAITLTTEILPVTVSTVTEGGSGLYTLTLSGTQAGSASVQAMVDGMTLKQTPTLTLLPDLTTATISIEANKDQITTSETTDALSGAAVTATVKDAFNNIITNTPVFFNIQSGIAQFSPPTGRTDNNGVVKAVLTSTKANTVVVKAYLDDVKISPEKTIVINAGMVDTVLSSFITNKNKIGADGKEIATLNVKLMDQFSNPISLADGVTVTQSVAEGTGSLDINPLPMTEVKPGSGEYQGSATSLTRGIFTLTAHADGVALDQTVVIEGGAIIPEIRFANSTLTITYQKAPLTENNLVVSTPITRSVSIPGIPDGLSATWNSTNPQVASVDSMGIVTPLKSGQTLISVQTAPTDIYGPGYAQYKLLINKADPVLYFANAGTEVSAKVMKWAEEGVAYPRVTAHNSDFDSSALSLVSFTSSDTTVATVDNSAAPNYVTPVRPGTTTISAVFNGDERFNPSRSNYALTINKGVLNINFVNTLENKKVTDTLLQYPQSLPVEANKATLRWSSSDDAVTVPNNDGNVETSIPSSTVVNKPGAVQITVTSVGNDYFEESSGNYRLVFHGAPKIDFSRSVLLTKGIEETKVIGEDMPIQWRPIYADDDATIIVTNSGGEYEKVSSAIVKLLDSSNTILDSKTISFDTSSNTQYVNFVPKASYIEKTIKFQIEATGYFPELKTVKESVNIPINTTSTAYFASFVAADFRDVYKGSWGWNAFRCKNALGQQEVRAFLQFSETVNFTIPGKTLLRDMTVGHRLNMTGGYGNPVDYGNSATFSTSGIKFSFLDGINIVAYDSPNYFDDQCWIDHWQTAHFITEITYGGVKEKIVRNFVWAGTGPSDSTMPPAGNGTVVPW